MTKKITVIPGDGIGKEITDAAVAVLKKIDEVYSIGLEFTWKDAGGTAYDKYGTPLPEDTVEAAKAADAVLFGSVGGDQWDHLAPDLRPERAILGLRKALGLYVNLRPVKVMDVLAEYSPLKESIAKGTDLVIVRELIGGIYFGDKCESEIHNGVERAWDLENYSIPEVERITRFAMTAARKRRGKVTSVDKSNVLATSRLWRRTVTRLAEDYPDVKVDHLYVDNCAMQLAIHPTQFDVIVTSNLFGDILSDEAAVHLRLHRHAPLGLHRREHQPLRTDSRLRAGHRGPGHRQSLRDHPLRGDAPPVLPRRRRRGGRGGKSRGRRPHRGLPHARPLPGRLQKSEYRRHDRRHPRPHRLRRRKRKAPGYPDAFFIAGSGAAALRGVSAR